jgi:hypothetical protein
MRVRTLASSINDLYKTQLLVNDSLLAICILDSGIVCLQGKRVEGMSLSRVNVWCQINDTDLCLRVVKRVEWKAGI